MPSPQCLRWLYQQWSLKGLLHLHAARRLRLSEMSHLKMEPDWPEILRQTCLPYPVSISLYESWWKENNGLDFLSFLYAELLSQLSVPYPFVPQELQMISKEVVKLTKTLVPLSLRMDPADLTFDDIRMSLDLVKRHTTRLSQKVRARLEGPLRLATDLKIDTPTTDDGLTDNNSSYRISSATYQRAHSGSLPFSNSAFSAIPLPPIDLKGDPLILFNVFDSPALLQNSSAPSRVRFVPAASGFRYRIGLYSVF